MDEVAVSASGGRRRGRPACPDGPKGLEPGGNLPKEVRNAPTVALRHKNARGCDAGTLSAKCAIPPPKRIPIGGTIRLRVAAGKGLGVFWGVLEPHAEVVSTSPPKTGNDKAFMSGHGLLVGSLFPRVAMNVAWRFHAFRPPHSSSCGAAIHRLQPPQRGEQYPPWQIAASQGVEEIREPPVVTRAQKVVHRKGALILRAVLPFP